MRTIIEQQVMGRVAVIYGARQLVSAVALKLYVLAASALTLWRLTWVHKVLQNFAAAESRGVGATEHYLVVAVEHTHLAVQLTLLVATVICFSLAVDLFRSASRQHAFV